MKRSGKVRVNRLTSALRNQFYTLLLTSPLRAAKGKPISRHESGQSFLQVTVADREEVAEGSREWARLREHLRELGWLQKGDSQENVRLRALIQELSLLRHTGLSTLLDFLSLMGTGVTPERLAALEGDTHYEDRQVFLDNVLGKLATRPAVDLELLYRVLRQAKDEARSAALQHHAEERYREEMREFLPLWTRLQRLARRNRYCKELRDLALRDDTIRSILEQPRQFPFRRARRGPPDQPFLRTSCEGMTRAGVPKDQHNSLLRAVGLLPWQ